MYPATTAAYTAVVMVDELMKILVTKGIINAAERANVLNKTVSILAKSQNGDISAAMRLVGDLNSPAGLQL